MSNKIMIDGKEYTERVIESINVDGVKSESNIISTELSVQQGIINASINLGSSGEAQIDNASMQSIENENTANILQEENIIKETFISKVLSFIKKIF
ncbi:MAG: hypothetical protein ACRC3Y_05665 [Romboutsia sp.]|uniref:hypothetical protein n=1 Tax=Romboutsia sp. TaxID=1965302 RepID=UPI003F2B1738